MLSCSLINSIKETCAVNFNEILNILSTSHWILQNSQVESAFEYICSGKHTEKISFFFTPYLFKVKSTKNNWERKLI